MEHNTRVVAGVRKCRKYPEESLFLLSADVDAHDVVASCVVLWLQMMRVIVRPSLVLLRLPTVRFVETECWEVSSAATV